MEIFHSEQPAVGSRVGGLTTAAESWSLCLDFAGIMRRIHLDPDGCHRNSLNNSYKQYCVQTHTF